MSDTARAYWLPQCVTCQKAELFTRAAVASNQTARCCELIVGG